MKKLILSLIVSLLLLSCGNDKKVETPTVKEEIKDTYFLSIDAIYKKNDTCSVFIYDENNNEVLSKKVRKEIIGSEGLQTVTLELPTDVKIYNLGVGFSSNKLQDSFTLKSITIRKNNDIIVRPDNYLKYFANNDAMVLDMNTSVHKLIHDKDYPAGFVGNENLQSLLSQ